MSFKPMKFTLKNESQILINLESIVSVRPLEQFEETYCSILTEGGIEYRVKANYDVLSGLLASLFD